MSFTDEILLKWHALDEALALQKVAAYAGVIDAEAPVLVEKYKDARKKYEAAQAIARKVEAQRKLAMSLDGVSVDCWDSGNAQRLVEAFKSGIRVSIELQVREVEFADGTTQVCEWPVVRAVSPGMVGTKGAPKDGIVVSSPGAKYVTFHKGERVVGHLSTFVKETYPDSAATAALIDYANKDNNAKLGAWEAIKRDPAIRDLFTREKQIPAA